MTDDEALTLDFLASELGSFRQPMELVLLPLTVVQLVAALQLARRHPQFAAQEAVAVTVERFLDAAREYFADCPTVLEVIRRGDDSAFDRPQESRF